MRFDVSKTTWPNREFEGYLFGNAHARPGTNSSISSRREDKPAFSNLFWNACGGVPTIIGLAPIFVPFQSPLSRAGLFLIMAGVLVETIPVSILCMRLRTLGHRPVTRDSLLEEREKTVPLIGLIKSPIAFSATASLIGSAFMISSLRLPTLAATFWILDTALLVAFIQTKHFLHLRKPVSEQLAEIEQTVLQLDSVYDPGAKR